MCVYCMTGDFIFRHDPPWTPSPWPPMVPMPIVPMPAMDWPLGKLKEYHDLLKRIKALEDALGCPCEPNKADYLTMFEERIKALEEKARASGVVRDDGTAAPHGE